MTFRPSRLTNKRRWTFWWRDLVGLYLAGRTHYISHIPISSWDLISHIPIYHIIPFYSYILWFIQL